MFSTPLYIFIELQIWLQNNINLKLLEHIRVLEKLAILVNIIGWKTINQGVWKRFQYFENTLSQYFYNVLDALVEILADRTQTEPRAFST